MNEPINILIVDDEERNLTVLESILDLPSYRLVRADSADRALLALVAEEFALLILDVRMPNMTGFELAQVIKQRKKTACVPIIFLTAYYNEDQHVLEGYESGAVDYLHKPINAAVLRSKVAVFADLHRKTRELQKTNLALQAEVEARRRFEDELRRLNETLEERVLQRTTELQESEEKFRVIFNSTFQFIGLLDSLGTVLEVNQTALATWGAEVRQVVGKPFWEGDWWRSFPGERDRVYRAVMRATAGEFVRFEAKYLLRDGSEATMDVSISPVLNEQGQVTLLVPEGRDITAMKKSEQALLDMDRRRNEFLAVLAHELRNPLAPVRNAIQILGMKDKSSSDLDWAVKVIDRQIEQMARLIDDLMDVSRINQGKIELRREPVPLQKIVDDVVESSRSFIAQCGHELRVNLPPAPVVVDADPVRLSQSLLNLLNNAAKYTEQGGQIDLTAKQQGSEVLLSIKDTGVGIPTDKLNSIFDMFAQIEGTLSRSNGGLGIGLSIVKRLVEMHGGTITCTSAGPGTGSEFTIRLPLAVGEQRIAHEIESTNLDMHGSLRILVVDDNHDASSSLALMLRLKGNVVCIANDGEEAVACALEFCPDVVLCDIGLPKMNGYEACRIMKERMENKEVVLIAVTGWGQDADRQKSREAGFDYHLVKPVDPKQIFKLLDLVVSWHSQRQFPAVKPAVEIDI